MKMADPMRFKFLILVTLLALALLGKYGICAAQEKALVGTTAKQYTLPNLLAAALKNAENIKISQEDVFIAEKDKSRALSVLIPQVDTFGEYTEFSSRKTSVGDAIIQPKSSATWGLKIGQSFTLNGKELIAYGITKDNIEKSKSDLNTVKESYLLTVSSAFYDVLISQKTVSIARANVKRLVKHKDSVDTRLKLEEVTKTAMFRVASELSGARSALIRRQNLLKLAKTRLARLVLLTPDFDVVEPDFVERFHLDQDLETMKETALTQRSEIKSLALQQQISEDTIDFERGDYWPKVSLEGRWIGRSEDPENDLVPEDSLSITARLDFTLFDGGLRTAEVAQAKAAKRQAVLALEQVANDISVEVEQAYLDLTTQQSTLKSLEDQLTFASENFNAVSKQFDHGLSDSVDVMDANTQLVTSELELVNAKYGYQLAIIKLERAKGSFLTIINKMIAQKP